MTISSDPEGPLFEAASSVELSCTASGVTPFTAVWTSTCSGDCFILGVTESSLYVDSVHYIDSGTHSCTLTDALGDSGMASISMSIGGKCT